MADGVIFGGGRDALSVANAFRRENGLPELTAEEYHDRVMASIALVTGTGDADVRQLRVGGFDVAKVELPTRAAFEAATIPDWVKEWSFYSHPVPSSYTMKLEFVRDNNGIACESANGVKGSPAGQPTAMHYGIMPGAVVPAGLIEAATADCDARGWQLYFPGSPEKYDVTTHHIFHCNIRGDGSSGERSDGHQTVFRSVGLGTAVRWHDYGRAEGAGDVARAMLVFGRSELTIRDVRFENAANWEHYVLAPGTRKCWAESISGTGAADVGVLFDNTWSDRHTVLMALHPTIRPGAGCNECGVRNPDLQSATFGWGIVGTERNPDHFTPEQWIWGYGGASDFRAEGGRGDGFVLDAACKNAAWMIQSITVDGYAPRIGSNPVMFRIFRASDVILNNFYGEATAVQGNPTPARIEVSSETAARGTGKIIVNNCDVIRANVWMDGVDTGQTLTAGGGGLPFWDITTKSGTRFVYGKVVNEEGVTGTVGIGFTPFGIRPLFNLLGSLGTSTREWLTVRAQRLRTNSPRLWIRTKQDGVTEPGLFISIGNSNIRWLFEKNRILAWVPGIARPYSLDDDEVPVDPETASDGLVLSPNNIRPNSANGAGLGATSYPWSALRSSTVYTDAVVFGATTSGTVRILSGTTSPEGNVAAPVGTLYLQDSADGAFSTEWRKAFGTGNTGWVRGQADLVRGRTRAAFVAEVAAGFDPPVDTVIFAGGDAYRRVSGATWIDALPGWMPEGAHETPQHHGGVDDFVWATKTGTDNTAAIRKVLLSPRRAYFPRRGTGDYRVTGELEVTVPGKIIEFENAGGYGYGDDAGALWSPNVRIVATGTFTKRIRTRRLWRGSASDPQDAPLSVVLNIQAEGVLTRNIAIHLWKDYSDPSHTNFGDNCDVAIFHGTRVGIRHESPQIIGDFRSAGIYHDFSNAYALPRFPSLAGPAYDQGSVRSGADGFSMTNQYIRGPRRGFVVLGGLPKPGATDYSDPYYDQILGATVSDARGSFGSSDLMVWGGRIYGPDHHSNRRLKDPVLVGGVLTEAGMESEPDDAPCAVQIDGLAANASDGAWGIRFFGVRIASFEAFRARLGRAARVSFIGCHIEGRNGGRMDTAGNPINSNDYVSTSYGDIAGTSDTERVSYLQSVRQTRAEAAPHYYGETFLLITDTGRMFMDGGAYFETNAEADYRSAAGTGHRWRHGATSLALLDPTRLELALNQYLSAASGNMDVRAASGAQILNRIGTGTRTVLTDTEYRLASVLLRFGNGTSFPAFQTYAGSPEGNLALPPNSLVMDTVNNKWWRKKTGTGNTGFGEVVTT